jgi:anti-sigma B factor antagonist
MTEWLKEPFCFSKFLIYPCGGLEMLAIQEFKERDIIVLQVAGKMLDTDARALSEKVKELVTGGVRKIILDLSGINLMNSCFGLGIIASCWGNMNRANGKLVIANPSPKVTKLLEITKLNQVFAVYKTIEEAKNSL